MAGPYKNECSVHKCYIEKNDLKELPRSFINLLLIQFSMKFAIRDDDTSYFTQPKDLEVVYGAIWKRCPISLAIVPFHACTKSKGIPQKYWSGDKVIPVGDNKPLVAFLKKKIQEGKVSILLHGYSHKNYSTGPEFVAGNNLYEKVKEGKKYLETLFGVEVKSFVPPHNKISEEGRKAVAKAGLNIACHQSYLPWLRKMNWKNAKEKALFYLVSQQIHYYPFVLQEKGYKELQCVSLVPSKTLKDLQNDFMIAAKEYGHFCLNTHYWEVKGDMKKTFDEFMRWVHTFMPKYGSVDELFK